MTPKEADKFGPCPCSHAEENWELLARMEYIDDETNEGAVLLEYKCFTCGETTLTGIDLHRA